MENYLVGFNAARVDWYWESHGFNMNYHHGRTHCQKVISEGKGRDYHKGYVDYGNFLGH
jgi:hypothetical protein